MPNEMKNPDNKRNQMKNDKYDSITKDYSRKRKIRKSAKQQTNRISKKTGTANSQLGSINSHSTDQHNKNQKNVNPICSFAYKTQIMAKLRKEGKKPFYGTLFLRSQLFNLLRFKIVNRLFGFQKPLEIGDESLFLAIHLFDKFLSKKEEIVTGVVTFLEKLDRVSLKAVLFTDKPFQIPQLKELDVLATLSLFIACKYQEIEPPALGDFADFSSNDINYLIEKENDVLEALNYMVKPTVELSVLEMVGREMEAEEAVFKSVYRLVKLGVVSGLIRKGATVEVICGLFLIKNEKRRGYCDIKATTMCGRFGVCGTYAKKLAGMFLEETDVFRHRFSKLFISGTK